MSLGREGESEASASVSRATGGSEEDRPGFFTGSGELGDNSLGCLLDIVKYQLRTTSSSQSKHPFNYREKNEELEEKAVQHRHAYHVTAACCARLRSADVSTTKSMLSQLSESVRLR